MREANSSAGTESSPAVDGGGKAEPRVPPTDLIDRLERLAHIHDNPLHGEYKRGYAAGLRRAIQIIQANEVS